MIKIIKSLAPKDQVLQRKLLWIVVALIVISAFSVATPIGYAVLVARKNVSRLYTQQAINQAENQFSRFIEPIYANLSIIKSWGESDLLSLKDPKFLDKILMPIMHEMTYVETLAIANTESDHYVLYMLSNEWHSSSSFCLEPGLPKIYNNYNLQERSWFSNALEYLEKDQVRWSAPYKFINQNEGITASLAWDSVKNHKEVVAADIDDKAFKQIIPAVMSENNGHVFIALGASTDKQLASLLPLTDAIDSSLMTNTVLNFTQTSNQFDQIYRFNFNNQNWWAGAKKINLRNGIYWIYAVMPATSLHDEIMHERYSNVGIIIAIIMVGGLFVIILLRSYSKSLVQLSQMRKIIKNSESSLRDLINTGESDELEFKSTLRMNLGTGKAGKEIEYAALKTMVAFLNTNGGTLLIGVQDDGTIFGLDADGFENEDKFLLHFNNLINNHIGLEFSSFIKFELRAIEGNKIFVIEIEPANEPVFLKSGKQEDFLIRVGPSSRKLSNSQTVDYIQKKK